MDNLQTRLKTKFLTICECFSNFEKVFLWLFFCLFVLLTAVGAFTHEPWFDEAQAWLIAQDLSLVEMFKHLKYEGHLCLWFLALMPSAKLNLPYPLPMLITNVIFIWGAVYVLLMKSPFHPVLRIMIAFSMPIAYQYGVIARPYAMGVMFLFLLAYFYKDKLNRPYLYATLIILCANTSAMALVGMNYIDNHIYSIKNLRELAATTNYSYNYLSNLFKKTTGTTLQGYYHNRRLETAELLISLEDFTVGEIAGMLGYSSVYPFSLAFKKKFGYPPSDVKKDK